MFGAGVARAKPAPVSVLVSSSSKRRAVLQDSPLRRIRPSRPRNVSAAELVRPRAAPLRLLPTLYIGLRRVFERPRVGREEVPQAFAGAENRV
mgnify:CR=1 FL=1